MNKALSMWEQYIVLSVGYIMLRGFLSYYITEEELDSMSKEDWSCVVEQLQYELRLKNE